VEGRTGSSFVHEGKIYRKREAFYYKPCLEEEKESSKGKKTQSRTEKECTAEIMGQKIPCARKKSAARVKRGCSQSKHRDAGRKDSMLRVQGVGKRRGGQQAASTIPRKGSVGPQKVNSTSAASIKRKGEKKKGKEEGK